MRDRLTLHETLCDILGSRNVYYNPPENLKMKYPCIRYHLEGNYKLRANDSTYKKDNRYQLIVIDTDPESEIPDRLEELNFCNLDRTYKAEGLYHTVLTIIY